MVTNKVKNTRKFTERGGYEPESTDVGRNTWKRRKITKEGKEKVREKG